MWATDEYSQNDRLSGAAPTARCECEDALKRINEAHDVLADAAQRRAYDNPGVAAVAATRSRDRGGRTSWADATEAAFSVRASDAAGVASYAVMHEVAWCVRMSLERIRAVFSVLRFLPRRDFENTRKL